MNDPEATEKQSRPADANPESAANNEDTFSPGSKLDSRYLIERELGHGGIGVVYLARDLRLHNMPVVVKVLLAHLPPKHKEWFENKFKGEIAALARIDHPGVVRAIDIGQLPDGRSYLVMQYVAGENLRSIMKEDVDLTRVANLIRQTGQALTAAHEHGVIHRDLKPENIMLQKVGVDEYVKLIDFGIATVQEAPSDAPPATTMIAGTTAYMAPEQFEGKPTAASDTYALGVIAYEILTHRLPFASESPFEIRDMQRDGVRVEPCDLRPDLPELAQAAILKALSYNQHDRPPRARDFGEAFAQAILQAQTKSQTTSIGGGSVIDSGSDHRSRAGANRDKPPDDSSPATLPRLRPKKAPWMVIAAGIAVTAIAIFLLWRYLPSGQSGSGPQGTTQPAPSIAVAERRLSYWLKVQRNPQRYPRSKPFNLASEDIVLNNLDNIQLHFSSPQQGFLYLINEGPRQSNGLPQFIVMFPLDNGSAELAAKQESQSDWFQMDKEEGVEKIWIVWSEHRVPEMEAVKGWADLKHGGEIGDA
jgi:serine/threonine protein kinase